MTDSYRWWRDAIVYQVYIRSFADSNGDGTGDIPGLTSRLPYIRSLGVDAIWVNPWYRSPLNDGGYDVADYREIHPSFGDLDDARELIDEATKLGLRVLVDLVPNHTSSEHAWFQAALAAGPGSPERALYHFLPGRGEDGELPPSDWRSVFGGPAWTRVEPDGEWYLHLFDVTQPDLNWSNPKVRAEFRDILRFWLDLGASGFRVDVAHALVKQNGYPDVGETEDDLLAIPKDENSPMWDREELHEIVREWRSVLDEYPDSMMIAEAWVPSWDRLARYIRPGEYHQAFDFDFLRSPWDAKEMRTRIDVALVSAGTVGSVPTWVLSNHDVVRHRTRYALPQDVDERHWLLDGDRSLLDEEKGLLRARAATLLMLALPGSCYLYQGEELGLPEAYDLPLDVLEDPVWERSGHRAKGRDGCRVPIPWTRSGPSLGFGSGDSWLPQPEDWDVLSVAAQDGAKGSTLEMYRQAIRLRDEFLGDDESMGWIDMGDEAIAFRRAGKFICIVNFGEEPLALPAGETILQSRLFEGTSLPVDHAIWMIEEPD